MILTLAVFIVSLLIAFSLCLFIFYRWEDARDRRRELKERMARERRAQEERSHAIWRRNQQMLMH
jgi:hypothetical protein